MNALRLCYAVFALVLGLAVIVMATKDGMSSSVTPQEHRVFLQATGLVLVSLLGTTMALMPGKHVFAGIMLGMLAVSYLLFAIMVLGHPAHAVAGGH